MREEKESKKKITRKEKKSDHDRGRERTNVIGRKKKVPSKEKKKKEKI